MTLDEGHYYIYFFCCDNLWKSNLWLWKSLEISGNFFSYFVASLYIDDLTTTDLASWKISNGHISLQRVIRSTSCLVLG